VTFDGVPVAEACRRLADAGSRTWSGSTACAALNDAARCWGRSSRRSTCRWQRCPCPTARPRRRRLRVALRRRVPLAAGRPRVPDRAGPAAVQPLRDRRLHRQRSGARGALSRAVLRAPVRTTSVPWPRRSAERRRPAATSPDMAGHALSVTATAPPAHAHAMSSDSETGGSPLDVAIVGGGIIGLGLRARDPRAGHARGRAGRARASAPAHRAATPAGSCRPSRCRSPRPGCWRPACARPLRPHGALVIRPTLETAWLRWLWQFRRQCRPEAFRRGLLAHVRAQPPLRSRSSTLTRVEGIEFESHATGMSGRRPRAQGGSVVHDALRRAAGGWPMRER